jgi:adenylate cyclase
VSTKRKLAAILAADCVGYSKLMADDDAATVRSLNDARALFRARIESHGGVLIDTAGDSVLAEFPSAIEAADCAVEIQHELAKRNSQLADHRRMHFRIGINLGDVIEDDGTLYGDGINVAARLQSLAEPGGICVSGTAFDQVDGKLPIAYKFMGDKVVKNISKPVRTYYVLMDTFDAKRSDVHSNKKHRVIVLATAAVLLIGAAGVVWKLKGPFLPGNDLSLAMPAGPSIAVLPFTNMSGDSGEDYFSDGLSEDIITELARVRDLHVLARNTTFKYKGRTVDVQEVGRTLGANYVLEGSVRRTKSRVRITAQLIDVGTGSHVWAERYDRDLLNLFDVQDELTGQVVGAIAGGFGGVLQRETNKKIERKAPNQLAVYDLVLQASAQPSTKESWPVVKAILERAMEVDPSYARARQDYAWAILHGWVFRYGDAGMTRNQVLQNAIQSVQFDPSNAFAHRTAAFGYFFDHQMDSFRRETREAFERAPYNAEIFAELGFLIGVTGDWKYGVELAQKAHRLNPSSASGWYHSTLFYDHYLNGRYKDAIEIMRQHPNPALCENQMKFIVAYGQLGQREQAAPYYERCQKDIPDFSPDWMATNVFQAWNFRPQDIKKLMDGFAKAGYPCKSCQ